MLLAAVAVFQCATVRPGHDWGDDFAQYLLHARNLVTGQPYAETGYIFNPQHANIGPAAYPPVFPLLLAPVYALAGLNPPADPPPPAALPRRPPRALAGPPAARPGWGAGALLLAVLGFNPYLADFKNQVLSEFLFLGLVFAALAAFERLLRLPRLKTWQWVGMGVLAYLAYGTRSVGAALLPCFVLAEWAQTRRITLRAVGSVLVALLLAALQALWVPGTSSYFSMLKFDPGVSLVLLQVYLQHLAEFWGIAPSNSLTVGLFALLIIGLWAHHLLRRRSAVDFFFGIYGAVIILWGDYQGMRFIFPLAYLSGYYLFNGVLQGLAALNTRRRYQIGGAVLLALLAAGLPQLSAARFTTYTSGPETPYAQALFAAIRQNTSPADKLVFFKPRAMALYTGRACSGFDRFSSDEQLEAWLAELQPQYLVAERVLSEYTLADGRFYLEEYANRHAGQFELVYENADFKLFRVLK